MALAQHEVVRAQTEANRPLEYDEDGQRHILGFWLFLATDLVLFACLFATYQVLVTHTDGGPVLSELFELGGVTAETILLLTSSFTGGLAIYEMRRGNLRGLIGWLVFTVMLGLAFIGIEVYEFVTFVGEGATMQRSAALSAFFTLVGTHGLHVSFGILWMISVIVQLLRFGIQPVTARKAFIAGLYWHFLDVVWVFVFSAVYLMGVLG
ncbi:cytochrome aa3-600 menaquinol oxidase subunit 3 [Melghirimyces thermohalophilus]|uniref:Cytochrome aa3-600 menaquinol oxidase subunit 3 n=1 Tax=Melghirimyces thermohalophilus TaxID=1236220 RepID=A0A1G6PMR3_9BACL|nr:cytochrome (ubi)quinol oxidase subunit III [Melghirimyces thermohalophilus]SDC81261.1 cytochrome aa3-600 menaquinol oxidase subunit 3 [Melghirimyces thermohalophilus]